MITVRNYRWFHIGAKAERLFQMQENGLNVPELFCVNEETEEEEVEAYVRRKFAPGTLFAVRSSAAVEDSAAHSFAGQLNTYLFVPAEQLWEKICFSRASADTKRVREYLRFCGIRREDVELHVIVQVMADADYTGVIFTANPQGILNETVITVGAGIEDGTAEDHVPVNTYYCSRSDHSFYAEIREDAPKLDPALIESLLHIAEKIRAQFGCECDIEYGVKDGVICILQARPITTLHSEGHIILDSSHISDQCPGTVSPLTASFVKGICHRAVSRCVKRLTRNDGTAERMDSMLADLIDTANGRLYYRLNSCRSVISVLPFSKKLLPVWEETAGIADSGVRSSADAPKRSTKIRVLCSLMQYLLTNKRRMQAQERSVDAAYPMFRKRIRETEDPAALLRIIPELADMLAECCERMLLNDIYAAVYRELGRRSSAARGCKEPAHQAVCEPGLELRRYIAEICAMLREETLYEGFCDISDFAAFEQFLSCPSRSAKMLSAFMERFGDCGEGVLKLEAETYRTNPLLLVKEIAEYDGEMPPEETRKLHGSSGLFSGKAHQALCLHASADRSRSRLIGLMREILRKCGDEMARRGLIGHPRDLCFLTFDELMQASENEFHGIRGKIAARRRQWRAFEMIPPYSRIVFDRKVFDKYPANCISETVSREFDTSCSSGIAEGEITHISRMNGIEGTVQLIRRTG